MPRKTVIPDLDQFRPPGFDLDRYSRELKPRSPNEWYGAIKKRSVVLTSVENWSRAVSNAASNSHDSREAAVEHAQVYLPEVFGKSKNCNHFVPARDINQLPESSLSFAKAAAQPGTAFVKDMSTMRAIFLFNLMRCHRELARTSQLMEAGNTDWLDDPEEAGAIKRTQWGVPVISILKTSLDRTSAVPVEVNLRAPDVEIIAAFERWLESARKTYRVPQPRPDVLNKKSQAPVITQAMLHDWHRDRILPFLDLYLWNRLYNPPPLEGLWKATTPGRFVYQGASWTLTTKTWMELLAWDDERTFRRDILGKALDLLDWQIIDLLRAFARKNS